MATARMTDDLLKKLCDKYINDYWKVNTKPELDDELGLKIYNKYAKPFFDELETVIQGSPFGKMIIEQNQGNGVLSKHNDFSVHVYVPERHSKTQEYRKTKTASDGSAKEVDWQLKDYLTTTTWSDEDEDVYNATFQLPYEVLQPVDKYNSPMAFPLYTMREDPLYQEVVEQVKAKLNAKIALQNDVCEYFNTLDRFETLNQALKAWPQLATAVEQVMPEKMVAINRRTERKKKALENQNAVEEVSKKFNNVMLGSTLLGDDDDS